MTGNEAQVIIDIITKNKSSAAIKAVNKDLLGLANSAKAAFKPVGTITSDIGKRIEKLQPKFAGFALSVMFAGMALKQMFNTIWQFGSKTFNDIMHSVEGTVTGFDILNNSITYLGFVIGQALEPVAMWLAPIIDNVSEWIQNNQTLFTTLVVIAGVLGTLLFTFGFMKLALDGFVGSILFLKSTWAVTSALSLFSVAFWTALWGKITLMTTALWGMVAPIVAAAAPWLVLAGIIIGGVALGFYLGAVWKQVLEGWKLKIDWVGLAFQGFWINMKIWAADGTTWIVEKIRSMIVAWNSLPFTKNIPLTGIDNVLSGLKDIKWASQDALLAVSRAQSDIEVKMGLNEKQGNVNLSDSITNLRNQLGLGTDSGATNNTQNTTNNVFNFYGLTPDELVEKVQARTA